MSAVVGIDVSTRALDLVKLDEDSNRAEWVRCELVGKTAWERTLSVAEWPKFGVPSDWWSDVYLCCIEEPRGRGQLRTNAVLNRVVGAVAASLPARLRCPERCWVVRPDEWKSGLGLPHNAKPDHNAVGRIAPGWTFGHPDYRWEGEAEAQNARDAYCLAYWAREQVNKAVWPSWATGGGAGGGAVSPWWGGRRGEG